jgi:predicted Ser/Thr protein kinase
MNAEGDKKLGRMPTVSGVTPDQGKPLSFPPPRIRGYEIIGDLGEAGQGCVWRALQLSTRREVALKVPRVDLLRSRKALARFQREIELAARLNHPNIARIYDSGTHQGLYYYAMELIEGLPLDEYVRQHKLSARQTMILMQTVCEAVQHAHQNGVIHRDLKPSNILVSEDGQPHVVDFGLAIPWDQDHTFRTVSTDGEITGTPAYMSPEQAVGQHEQLDTRTDVYSLGVVLYELLTGAFPYDVNTSMAETLRHIRDTDPVRPSKIVRSLDRDIDTIVLKALAKEPERRYQSITELRHDIEAWLAGLPILARSGSSFYLLRKVMARHRHTSTVVGLLALIVVAFGYVSFDLLLAAQKTQRELEIVARQSAREAAANLAFARQTTLTFFLQAWQDRQTERAQAVAAFFRGETGSREEKAIRFLFDERPLEQKVAEFRQGLNLEAPGFTDFIIGEHHLHDGNRLAAFEAYQCSWSTIQESAEDQSSRADRWLATHVKARLAELKSSDAPAEQVPPDEDGG